MSQPNYQTETAKEGQQRFCEGHLATSAADGVGVNIAYSFERRDDGQVYIRVGLLH